MGIDKIMTPVLIKCEDCAMTLSVANMSEFASIAEIRKLRFILTERHKKAGECK